jgi:succinoglycan biosynthesis transport protein ExoP
MAPSPSFAADLFTTLRQYPLRWIVPTVLIASASGVFAYARAPKWEASQAMIVRNESSVKATHEQQGKFDQPEQRKIVQETLMELVRSRKVLGQAMTDIRLSESGAAANATPTDMEIDIFRERVTLEPPKGAVFGRTEVFYLRVKDPDRQRAVALVQSLCRHLQEAFKQVRDNRAYGLTTELQHAAKMAEQELQVATDRMASLETKVGSDLSELRILHASPSGNSDLRRRQSSLETELRSARQVLQSNREMRKLLVAATEDSGTLVATPNTLLVSQPALRRFKDGLIDAQIRTSALLGRYTADHPTVKQSQMAEAEIARDLATELNVAIRGIDVDLGLTKGRVDDLQTQLNDVRQRLVTLAAVRASYGNLVRDIQQRSEILKAARGNLADTRGNRLATDVTSQISLINEPDTGSQPVDPNTLAIIAAGIVGGLAVGIGIVFLTVHPTAPVVPAVWEHEPPARSRDKGSEKNSEKNNMAAAPAVAISPTIATTTLSTDPSVMSN